jgi:SAM-dependent methyltransferase
VTVAAYFDELYSAHERYWWRAQERYSPSPDAYPGSLITQQTLRLIKGRPPGRALDLGAGEGSDAIRLALLGYHVDAVEISSVAAAKIRAFAAAAGAGAQVNVTVADVAEFTPAAGYDVVICNGVLHYVQAKEAVVTAMQQATVAGGLNVVSLWSSYSRVPDCHDRVPAMCDDEDGLVVKLYQCWPKELLYFERNKLETSHDDLPPHTHSHIKLIARRPG